MGRKYKQRNRTNAYLTSEVADVCLNCKNKQCVNMNDGCLEYRAAMSRVGKRGGTREMVITAGGMTMPLSEWAVYLGIEKNVIYRRAYNNNRPMEEEIELRLKERGGKV